MENNGRNIGSEWRIWDLHVHSPASYGGSYQDFIDNAKASIASVIGINDYCTLAGYEEILSLGGIPGKVIFPIVEFRMNNIVANRKNSNPVSGGTKINFHIICNDDATVFPLIKSTINAFNCFDENGNTVPLGSITDYSKISIDYNHVLEKLKLHGLYGKHCLIWLPYDEYGGIDEIDPEDNFFKLGLINSAHILGSSYEKQIKFFKWNDDKYSREQYESWFDKPKPCIKGSDAHKVDYPFGCLRNSASVPVEKYCWISANTTFEGLKQIINEPDRVYIGLEPRLLTRIRENKTKFIKSIDIRKVSGAIVDDVWFNDVHIDINSALVAIIGNKGSGKSAITDIISLCGNTKQDPTNFSFLQSSKFRKQRPYNLSERFEATLTWEDDTKITKKLSDNPNDQYDERVKYIPQNFLERLCTNVDSDDFESELKKIIYTHTPQEERFNKASLDELIGYKSDLITDEIVLIQNEISKLNSEIVKLENKDTNDYKNSIRNSLDRKKEELAAHTKILPQEPEAKEDATDNDKLKELNQIRKQIQTIEQEISEISKRKSALLIDSEKLSKAFQYYENLNAQLKKYLDPSNEYAKILDQNGIMLSDVFTYSISTLPIQVELQKLGVELATLNNQLDATNGNSKTNLLEKLTKQLVLGQDELEKPAKEQQKYLDELKKWQSLKEIIEGNDEIEGSLKYYEFLIKYLSKQLGLDLASKRKEREKHIEDLFQKKLELIDIRKELYKPVTQFIEDFKELKERYDVKIDVSLELRKFQDIFFNLVGQNKTGTFYGKEEGYKNLQDIIERSHFDGFNGFTAFVHEIVDSLVHNKRLGGNPKVDLNGQMRKGVTVEQFYDFLYQLEYLQPVFSLKLGDKTLQELSPGERGALLLIFYLILDKDDIPLIIDQPEENLDNQSVYHILVHFIKKVKDERQIILVTHNPNLAVVCDANQIIRMEIEKENKNTVRFYSGAIEDRVTNRDVLDILEGTLPAFDNRDSKYIR